MKLNLFINSISCTLISFQPNHEKLEAKVNELKKAQMEAKNRAKGLSSDHGTPRDSSRQCKLLLFCCFCFFAQYLFVEYVFWMLILIQINGLTLFSCLQLLQKTWAPTQPYYPLWSGSKQRTTNTQRTVLCKYNEHCIFFRKICDLKNHEHEKVMNLIYILVHVFQKKQCESIKIQK